MSYVTSVLQPGEQVVYVARMHRIVYLPVLIGLIVLFGALYFFVGVQKVDLIDAARHYDQPQPLGLVAVGVVALCSFYVIFKWLAIRLRISSTEAAITTRRLIYKTGFIRRDTIEMNLARLELVEVEQSIWERILGLGHIVIKGIGGTPFTIYNISDPIRFRSHITAPTHVEDGADVVRIDQSRL